MERLGRRLLLGMLSLVLVVLSAFGPSRVFFAQGDCLDTLKDKIVQGGYLPSLEDFQLAKYSELNTGNLRSFVFPPSSPSEKSVTVGFNLIQDLRDESFRVREFNSDGSERISFTPTSAFYQGSISGQPKSLALLYKGRGHVSGFVHFVSQDRRVQWVFIEPLESLLTPLRGIPESVSSCVAINQVHIIYDANKTEFLINLEPKSSLQTVPTSIGSAISFTDSEGGTIKFGVGSTVYISVYDADERFSSIRRPFLSSAVLLKNLRTGESVTLNLNEFGNKRGKFISSGVQLGEPGSGADLEIDDFAILHAKYVDPADPTDTAELARQVGSPLVISLLGIGDSEFYDIYNDEVGKRWWEAQEEVLTMVAAILQAELPTMRFKLNSLEAWTAGGPGAGLDDINALTLMCHFAEGFVIRDLDDDGNYAEAGDKYSPPYSEGSDAVASPIYHTQALSPMIAHLFTGYDLGPVVSKEVSDSGCCICHSDNCGDDGKNIIGVSETIGLWKETSRICLNNDTESAVVLPHRGHHSLSQHAPTNILCGNTNCNYQGLLIQRFLLVAHEIGHNLGAEHSILPSIMYTPLNTMGDTSLGELGLGMSYNSPSAPEHPDEARSNKGRIAACLRLLACDR